MQSYRKPGKSSHVFGDYCKKEALYTGNFLTGAFDTLASVRPKETRESPFPEAAT